MSTPVKLISVVVIAAAAIAAFLAFSNSKEGTATAAPAKEESVVVAVVNGDEILKQDVMEVMDKMPPETPREEMFPMVVGQLVNQRLLDAQVQKMEFEKEAEFQRRVNDYKQQLVRQFFIEKILSEKVTDGAVKEKYEEIKKANSGKEEIRARHILVSTEEEAKKVIADLEGGAKFEELAKKRSSGPSAPNGGDLGYFTKEDMVPEFSAAALQLKKGNYTKTPVKTQFGWHVIKVEDKRARAVPALSELESSIRAQLGQDALGKLVEDLRTSAEIQLFDMNGKPLDPLTESN